MRVIELDAADNERTRSLINAAASATAAFRPEAATTISVFQTVLSFITQNNPDDIEFQFDVALAPQCDASTIELDGVDGKRQYMVLPTRVGRYAVIKTEHWDRLVYPNDIFSFGEQGVRLFLSKLLKLGTLGILNWTIWGVDPQDDTYLAIMGRPFAAAAEAWALPRMTKQGLEVAGHPIRARGNELYRADGSNFRDQGFLVFSVVATKKGLPIEELRKANAAKESINALVHTAQLSPEAYNDAARQIAESLIQAKADRDLDERIEAEIATATSAQDVEAALPALLAHIDGLDISESRKQALRNKVLREANAVHKAQDGHGQLGKPPLDRPVSFATRDADGRLSATAFLNHRKGERITSPDGRVAITSSEARAERVNSELGITLARDGASPFLFEFLINVGGVDHRLELWIVPPVPVTLEFRERASGSPWTPWTNQAWTQGSSIRLSTDVLVGKTPLLGWLPERVEAPIVAHPSGKIETGITGGVAIVRNESDDVLDPTALQIGGVPIDDVDPGRRLDRRIASELGAATTTQDVEAALNRLLAHAHGLGLDDTEAAARVAKLLRDASKRHVDLGGEGELAHPTLDPRTVFATPVEDDKIRAVTKVAHLWVESVSTEAEGTTIEAGTNDAARVHSTLTVELARPQNAHPFQVTVSVALGSTTKILELWIVPPAPVTLEFRDRAGEAQWTTWTDQVWGPGTSIRLSTAATVGEVPVFDWLRDRIDGPLATHPDGTPEASLEDGKIILRNDGEEPLDPRTLQIGGVAIETVEKTV